ncbi:MAG: hypothetical protein OEV08_13610 [Nitrospira sp.]|nr:hypothetical protein [Nitrospira sp.]
MAFDYNEIDEILKADPLGELSRKERRMSLLISTMALGISQVGLVPTKIVGFGVEFSIIDRPAILWLLTATVLYFMVTFLSYAIPDFLAWRVRYNKFQYELDQERRAMEDKYGPGYEEHSREAAELPKSYEVYSQSKAQFKTMTLIKIVLDLVVPVLVIMAAIGTRKGVGSHFSPSIWQMLDRFPA